MVYLEKYIRRPMDSLVSMPAIGVFKWPLVACCWCAAHPQVGPLGVAHCGGHVWQYTV